MQEGEKQHASEMESIIFQKGNLANDIEDLKKKNSIRKRWNLIWGLVIVAMLATKYVPSEYTSGVLWTILFYLSLLVSVLGLIVNSGNISSDRQSERVSQIELSILEDKLFAHEISEMTQEERAVRQLSKSQLDLAKYYDLNYTHVYKIFNIGRVLLIFGNLVVLATLISAILISDHIESLVLVFGFITGILVDFSGTIFVVIYSKTIKSANMNQYGMLETNQAYLGNVLASQIKNNEIREKTLSDMANKLISKEKKINFSG